MPILGATNPDEKNVVQFVLAARLPWSQKSRFSREVVQFLVGMVYLWRARNKTAMVTKALLEPGHCAISSRHGLQKRYCKNLVRPNLDEAIAGIQSV